MPCAAAAKAVNTQDRPSTGRADPGSVRGLPRELHQPGEHIRAGERRREVELFADPDDAHLVVTRALFAADIFAPEYGLGPDHLLAAAIDEMERGDPRRGGVVVVTLRSDLWQ